MTLRFLLDTNVVVRWLSAPKKLSREQIRIIQNSERHGEPLAISAISLIEIVTLRKEGSHRAEGIMDEILGQIEIDPLFQILPITVPIAIDVGRLSVLRDPADRTIAATARVHGLRLLTSDRRVVDSKLVSVIE